jgi:Protein of unknown function (DUF1236)
LFRSLCEAGCVAAGFFREFREMPALIRYAQNKTMELVIRREHLPSPFVVGAGNAITLRRFSMNSRFMMSVAAAALIAGTGFANAQGTGGREGGGAAGPAAQQSAPAAGGAATSHESTAPAGREAAKPAPSSGMKATQSEPKAPNAGQNQRAEENAPGQKPTGMHSETNTPNGAKDMKAEGKDKADGKDMKAEGRDNNMKPEGRDNKMNADSKGTSERTTGQAGAGGKLSGEQRTKITTVIKQQNIRPVEHVNFAISVGTRVPREVGFHPLPAEIVTIYPEWRGYEFILVNDQILVIDPRTLEIVDVLDA